MYNTIHVGFVEKCESWKLESRFFPSKVGGKPAWLCLKNIPTVKQLACDYCKNPCIFLCQVYAPYEEDTKAFHRTLYVFICKNPACSKANCNGNLKVFRSQLERINEFYLPYPPIELKDWRSDISIEKWCKTCHVCGIFSCNHCSKCKNIYYCCRLHQVWDWKISHKQLCGTDQNSNYKKFLFPEFELVRELEQIDQKHLNDPIEEEEFGKFENFLKTVKAGSLQLLKDVDDDLLAMANDAEDKTFSKFHKKIQNDPEQVLRYNRGGSPLLISSRYQPSNIPNCEKCGSERQFEFQIMPQLLLYLKIEDILNDIDWGILIIYTCKNSCIPQSGYVQEYIWKQDIVNENSSTNLNTNKK